MAMLNNQMVYNNSMDKIGQYNLQSKSIYVDLVLQQSSEMFHCKDSWLSHAFTMDG